MCVCVRVCLNNILKRIVVYLSINVHASRLVVLFVKHRITRRSRQVVYFFSAEKTENIYQSITEYSLNIERTSSLSLSLSLPQRLNSHVANQLTIGDLAMLVVDEFLISSSSSSVLKIQVDVDVDVRKCSMKMKSISTHKRLEKNWKGRACEPERESE